MIRLAALLVLSGCASLVPLAYTAVATAPEVAAQYPQPTPQPQYQPQAQASSIPVAQPEWPCREEDKNYSATEASACSSELDFIRTLPIFRHRPDPELVESNCVRLRECLTKYRYYDAQTKAAFAQAAKAGQDAADEQARRAAAARTVDADRSLMEITEPKADTAPDTAPDPAPVAAPPEQPVHVHKLTASEREAIAAKKKERDEKRAAKDAERTAKRAAADAEEQKSDDAFCGDAPKASPWDGIYFGLERAFKDRANDPDSIDFKSCTVLTRTKSPRCWVTKCELRGKNGFGALVLVAKRFGKSSLGWSDLSP